jgi:hypothetical protein
MREDSGATPLVKKQAVLLLARIGAGERGPSAVEIGPLRRHVHRFPDDALSWVDLALGYVVEGKAKKAERSMRVALRLDLGTSRFSKDTIDGSRFLAVGYDRP